MAMPAVLLGVLRAGAAYVPLDPDYPIDRLRFMISDSGARAVIAEPELWEQLGKHRHRVLLTQGVLSRGGTYEVPAGHYFMMGDHRDNSQDGRYEEVGFVPEGNLVGRATGVWMNWRAPSEGGPQWQRIGEGIQ